MITLKASIFSEWEHCDENKYILSVFVSEWLHVKSFWNTFNQKNNTLFQQYESDTLTTLLMKPLIVEVMRLIETQLEKNEKSDQFVCRQDSEGNEIIFNVDRRHIIKELKNLCEYLQQAYDNNIELECDL